MVMRSTPSSVQALHQLGSTSPLACHTPSDALVQVRLSSEEAGRHFPAEVCRRLSCDTSKLCLLAPPDRSCLCAFESRACRLHDLPAEALSEHARDCARSVGHGRRCRVSQQRALPWEFSCTSPDSGLRPWTAGSQTLWCSRGQLRCLHCGPAGGI